MPELPDVTVYVERLDALLKGRALWRIRIANPFLLRTALPPIGEAEGRRVLGTRRMGKRIVLALEGDLLEHGLRDRCIGQCTTTRTMQSGFDGRGGARG